MQKLMQRLVLASMIGLLGTGCSQKIELPQEPIVAVEATKTDKTTSAKTYDLGLTYTFTPALGVWTSLASNIGTSPNNSIGSLLARIASIDGDIAWVTIKNFNGSKFVNTGSVCVKVDNILGELAPIQSQAAIFSNPFTVNFSNPTPLTVFSLNTQRTEVTVPFLIKPGYYQKIYPMIVFGSTRYHANPITIRADGWMKNGGTPVQKNILNAAHNQKGKSSGQSVTSTNMWWTDMYVDATGQLYGDAINYKLAIIDYRDWKLNPNGITLTKIKEKMYNRLVNYHCTLLFFVNFNTISCLFTFH